MTFRLLTVCLSTLLLTGCGLTARKNDKPKESSAIAADTEATFRQRWMEKRTSELAAQGVEAGAARAQAANEFQAKFGLPARGK